jgi:hypothetical protein
MSSSNLRSVFLSIRRLASADPMDPKIPQFVAALRQRISSLSPESPPVDDTSPQASPVPETFEEVQNQIASLHKATSVPARNYSRMTNILAGLNRAAALAARPQNKDARPRITRIAERVAGLFAEIDTVEDLDKPLSEIEKAVHSLYGDQSKNDVEMFDRRGKGHHSKLEHYG